MRRITRAGVLGGVLFCTGCGSETTPGAAGGGAPSAGATSSAGSGAAGAGGGTAGAGTSGAAGVGAMGGAGGAGVSGAAGAGAVGGEAGAAAGAGGAAGAGAGGGGAGAGGMVGTATFTVEHQLASDVDPSAPTTVGIVTWSVDATGLTSANIEFGLDTNYGMRAPVDLGEPMFRTLLLGMKPAREYHFRIVAVAGTTTYMSGDYVIETGAPTTSVQISSFEGAASGRERGFIVTSYWRGTGSAVPFILDADGEIVWWYAGGPSGIARARMSADGKNLWMIVASNSGGALRRVSLDGLDGQTYSATVGSHDITPVSGETMAFLEYGESDCDSIFEIDPSGTTREVFESQGVVQSGGCHSNALRYSADEDVYTFSDVSQDILVINRQGSVLWRLSERTTGGNDAWGGTQHGHHLLAESMLVFANQGGGQGSSAFVEFSLMGQEIQRYNDGGFSQNLGDVQRLPGGNTLITYSNDGLIQEIDPDNNVVLEIDGGSSSFGYALWRETLYGPPPDIGQ